SGQIVNIGGESGVGKSRLVRELRPELELRGETPTLREYHCRAARQTLPLRPLLDLVHARFAIADSDSQEQVLAKIDAGLESIPELTAEAPYVRYVLSVDPREPA